MKEDRVYLLHIRDCAQRVQDYTRDGHHYFLEDTKTQDAVIRNIEIIGEAAKCLSAELKALHADIPWKQIGGMRDTHSPLFRREAGPGVAGCRKRLAELQSSH